MELNKQLVNILAAFVAALLTNDWTVEPDGAKFWQPLSSAHQRRSRLLHLVPSRWMDDETSNPSLCNI